MKFLFACVLFAVAVAVISASTNVTSAANMTATTQAAVVTTAGSGASMIEMSLGALLLTLCAAFRR